MKTMDDSALSRSYPLVGLAAGLSLAALVGCSSSDDKGSLINGSSAGGQGGASGSSSAGTSGSGATADASMGGGFIVGSGGKNDKDGAALPDGACALNDLEATNRQVNMLLVIDKSGSMADKPSGFSSDKWTAMKTALGSSLGAVKNDLSFGLELYPLSADPKNPIPVKCDPTNCCEMPPAPGIEVPVAAGTTSVPAIVTALNGTSPGGGTPTAQALQRAHDYFTTGAGKGLAGDKYVLLATDGGPNCNAGAGPCAPSKCTLNLDNACPVVGTDAGGFQGNCCNAPGAAADCLDDVATTAQVTALAKDGIKTFVVGIPGSEAYKTYLDEFAVAGGEVNPAGTPKYYAVTAAGGVGELTSVLTSITKQLITTCQLKLTTDPPDVNKINVYVDGKELTQGDPNGWTLDQKTSPPTIDLTGSTCTEVESKGVQSVKIVFGCPTHMVH